MFSLKLLLVLACARNFLCSQQKNFTERTGGEGEAKVCGEDTREWSLQLSSRDLCYLIRNWVMFLCAHTKFFTCEYLYSMFLLLSHSNGWEKKTFLRLLVRPPTFHLHTQRSLCTVCLLLASTRGLKKRRLFLLFELRIKWHFSLYAMQFLSIQVKTPSCFMFPQKNRARKPELHSTAQDHKKVSRKLFVQSERVREIELISLQYYFHS